MDKIKSFYEYKVEDRKTWKYIKYDIRNNKWELNHKFIHHKEADKGRVEMEKYIKDYNASYKNY